MNGELLAAFYALTFQGVLCGITLWAFTRKDESPPPWRLVVCALLAPLLALLLLGAIGDILLEGSLLFIWVLYSLIAHQVGCLRMVNAFLAMACFLLICLGWGHVQECRRMRYLEEERLLLSGFQSMEQDPVHEMLVHLLEKRLDCALVAARDRLRNLLADVEPPAPPPVAQTLPSPEPSPAPTSPAVAMSGSEFAKLFEDVSAETPTPLVAATPSPTSRIAATPTPRPTAIVVVTPPPALSAEELARMAKVGHRSTDPRFSPPDFDVSAVSIGRGGSFAIVNGSIIRMGAIVPSNRPSPRAWRLVNATPTLLYWQPVE